MATSGRYRSLGIDNAVANCLADPVLLKRPLHVFDQELRNLGGDV